MNGGGFGASSAGSCQGVGFGIGKVDGAGEFVGSIEIPFAGQFVSGQASAGSGGDGGEAAKS